MWYSGNCYINNGNSTVLCFRMFDKKRERDFWTFKPKMWVKTFHQDKTDSEHHFWDDFAWDFEYGKLKYPGNIQKQHFYSGKDPKSYKIETYLLYKIVPQDATIDEIKDVSSKLLEIMNSPVGHGLYQTQFEESPSPCIQASVKYPSGDYWKTSLLMPMKEPVIIEHNSLDCLFTCDSIWEIVGYIFGIPPQNTTEWDDEVKQYAFKQSLDEGKQDADLEIDYESLNSFQ